VPGYPFQEPGDSVEQSQPRGVCVGWAVHQPGVGGLRSRGGQLGKQPGQLGRVRPGEGVGIGWAKDAQQAAQGRRPGQNAGVGSASAQVPQPTSSPLRAVASPISVVFPIPASPPTSTRRVRPLDACSTAASRRDNARTRPTKALETILHRSRSLHAIERNCLPRPGGRTTLSSTTPVSTIHRSARSTS
jgi:hypothetical protein